MRVDDGVVRLRGSADGEECETAVEAFEIGLDRAWFVLDAGSNGEIDDGTRNHNFAGGGYILDARREVHREAADVVCAAFDLPGVYSRSDLEAEAACVVAHGDGGVDGTLGPVEGCQDAVADCLDKRAALPADNE